MSLSDFEIGYETVESRRGSFQVRGANAEDLFFVANHYLADILNMLGALGDSEDDLRGITGDRLPSILLLVVKDFPDLIAEMISRCSDEEGQKSKAAKLPFTIQLDAMTKIVTLTIEEAGDLKNLAAVLLNLLETKNLRAGPLTKRLQATIGSSGRTSA